MCVISFQRAISFWSQCHKTIRLGFLWKVVWFITTNVINNFFSFTKHCLPRLKETNAVSAKLMIILLPSFYEFDLQIEPFYQNYHHTAGGLAE